MQTHLWVGQRSFEKSPRSRQAGQAHDVESVVGAKFLGEAERKLGKPLRNFGNHPGLRIRQARRVLDKTSRRVGFKAGKNEVAPALSNPSRARSARYSDEPPAAPPAIKMSSGFASFS